MYPREHSGMYSQPKGSSRPSAFTLHFKEDHTESSTSGGISYLVRKGGSVCCCPGLWGEGLFVFQSAAGRRASRMTRFSQFSSRSCRDKPVRSETGCGKKKEETWEEEREREGSDGSRQMKPWSTKIQDTYPHRRCSVSEALS